MTSPTRSVVVRLSMDPSSYVAGAAKAEQSTLALDAATAKAGATGATSMEKAAAGAGKAEGSFGKLNQSAGALGVTLGGLAGVGVAVGAALSVKWAADYQSALVKLETTAGETHANLAKVGQGMLDMAGQVGIGADELAKGMYTVDSSGIHGADSLLVLKAAAQGAKQENADLSHVVDAVTTALHDYNLPAADAAKVTSQLITAVSHGKTTFDELTGAMHSVTPLAAALGVPLADIAGTLSSMTASGESADQAAQNMADALRHMQNPTTTMTAELAQLGITSTDLGPMLGQKGLAGTIQTISTAILKQMGPAGTVMLDALNKSKVATADLAIMLKTMPPALAKQSQALLDGNTSIAEYQKAAKGLGGDQGAMALQFLSLVKSSQGFNNMLKSGQPDVQTYTAALQKAMGTSAGLTVALQVTGEHAAATNAAIRDIAHASGDAQGNIKGWSEVQGNFNQQLSEFEQGAKSLAIEAGQHLLPVLTSTFGVVNRDVLPGLKSAGSIAGEAAHAFSELPAPIKDTAAALAAIKLAEAIGLWGRLTAIPGQMVTGVRAATASFGAFGDEMAVQQRLMQMEAADAELATTANANFFRALGAGTTVLNEQATSLSRVQAMMAGYDTALADTVLAEDAATASTGRLSAAMATAQIRGASALSTGLKGLLGVVGGPWGAVFLGATIGVMALESAIQKHDEQVKQATQDVLAWNKAISLGGGGVEARQATQHLDDLRTKIAALQKQIGSGPVMQGGIPLKAHLDDLKKELDQGTAAWKAQLAAMTPVEEAQTRVDIATRELSMAQKNNPPFSLAVSAAAERLRNAQKGLAEETERANDAAKTQIQRQQDQANAALGLLDAQRAAEMAQLQLADAIDQYNSDVKDGQHTTRQLHEEQIGLADSARQTAQAAADAAAAQAKQNGATDTASASQAAFIKSLQETAAHLDGDAKQAVLNMITALSGQQAQAMLTAGAINKLGITVVDLPNSHLVEIDVPTDDQMKKLHDLGYVTATLPNGKVIVTADTNPAQDEIRALLQRSYIAWVDVRAASSPNWTNGGAQRPGAAIGGIIEPFAQGGWYTPMSGRIADIVAPQTYRLIGDRVSGDEAFIPIDGSARSQQILAETAGRMGFGLASKERAAPLRTRELVGAGGGGSPSPIDYRQLGAAVAAAIPDRPTVHVDQWTSEAGQTPYETAEALAFTSRTRPNG